MIDGELLHNGLYLQDIFIVLSTVETKRPKALCGILRESGDGFRVSPRESGFGFRETRLPKPETRKASQRLVMLVISPLTQRSDLGYDRAP